jgi:hypothetical protein
MNRTLACVYRSGCSQSRARYKPVHAQSGLYRALLSQGGARYSRGRARYKRVHAQSGLY